MSDTPRTDAEVYADMDSYPIKEWVPAEVARQLERELAHLAVAAAVSDAMKGIGSALGKVGYTRDAPVCCSYAGDMSGSCFNCGHTATKHGA